MKGLMKGQVASFDNFQIDTISIKIKNLFPEVVEKKVYKKIILGSCQGCHGRIFEKKAMGVSKIVANMSQEQIAKALKGYKDGSYGGAMKGLMKGQVASLDDAAIEALAAEIKK
jgi:cytochrome c-type protein NapB